MNALRILIDENLSPTLVQRLAEESIFAVHIVHLGRAGELDADVWRYAYENDFVVLTHNARDFLQLASEVELHPGLVVLRPTGLSAERQWELLESVLESIRPLDLTNKVVEVYAPGEFELRDVPPR